MKFPVREKEGRSFALENELLIRKTLIAHVGTGVPTRKAPQVTITNLERKRCVIKCFHGD